MDKSIIIVGSGQGVGMETAKYFGRKGYKVGLIRRGERAVKKQAEELKIEGINTYIKTADANEPSQVEEAILFLAEKLGSIDVLLYNVPGPLKDAYAPIIDAPISLLQEFLTIRVVSSLKTAQAALPFLEKTKGTILYTSGQSDIHPFPNTGVIGVSQAGLRMLVTHLSNELKTKEIYVGYIPLDNPPLYTNKEKEKSRTDLPEDFFLEDRVDAKNVAKVMYQMTQTRDKVIVPIHSTVKFNS